jgi:hypothetical protein
MPIQAQFGSGAWPKFHSNKETSVSISREIGDRYWPAERGYGGVAQSLQHRNITTAATRLGDYKGIFTGQVFQMSAQ